ncbi:hypothetical protein BDZ90DRAFT_233470 [Jaminaea rosea]|uniref:Alpha/beta-hydrolase n=1 Tax=Jaminaea rosea TaxID=1569628 RepID=A0A316UM66_9BASI|nr:hypothetical protein BDZ90DRAFT_233470 [Jaminaea rosea]PWN26339.1 hypothetical protein BDZ90DRAFT_233470 [Jaminaea rosea]
MASSSSQPQRSLIDKVLHPLASSDDEQSAGSSKRNSKRFSLPSIGNIFRGDKPRRGSSAEHEDEDHDQQEEQDDQQALAHARSPDLVGPLTPSLNPPRPPALAGMDQNEAPLARQRSRSAPNAERPLLMQPPCSSSSQAPTPMPALAVAPDISRTLSNLSTSTLHTTLYGPQRLDDVPYSYRVPTPKQAFYDSHMGSSSGWHSVKGRAAGLLNIKVPWLDTKPNEAGVESAVADSSDDEPRRTTRDEPNGRRSSSSLFGLDSLGLSLISNVLPSFSPAPATSSQSRPPLADLDLIPHVGPRHPRARDFYRHPSLRGRNVVILGGYRGSVLRSATPPHQMLWIPLKVGATLRRPTLELGLDPEDEARAEDKVIAGETLGRIGRLVDMGARLHSKFERKGATVHSWGYDWRLSLGRSSAKLQALLLDLYNSSAPPDRPQDRRGAIVIAHSMGGLVALHSLSQISDPRAFHTLSFASSPFLGTPNILGPLAWGDTTLWNDTICSPRSTFSFRSSFYLLPRDGRCFEVGRGENGKEGKTYDVDFLDEKTWEWAGFSPVIKGTRKWKEGQNGAESENKSAAAKQPPPSTVASPNGEGDADPASSDDEHSSRVWSYLRRTLAEVRQFDQEIISGFSSERLARGEYPPLTMITSGRSPTTRGAIVDDDEVADGEAAADALAAGTAADTTGGPVNPSSSRAAWQRSVTSSNYERMVFGLGDGVITLQSSRSVPGRWSELLVRDDEEEGKDAWITQTGHRHVALLSDVDGVGRAVWVGLRARERARRRE